MSGYTAEHPMAERIAREGVGFIPKPFEVVDLLARVRRALRGQPEVEGTELDDAGGLGSV
jgi:hypothetical protein